MRNIDECDKECWLTKRETATEIKDKNEKECEENINEVEKHKKEMQRLKMKSDECK